MKRHNGAQAMEIKQKSGWIIGQLLHLLLIKCARGQLSNEEMELKVSNFVTDIGAWD